eukprot:12910987-Prorocentrum_lima.AAC.1
MGIYPLNACHWWLSAADARELAGDEGFNSNTKNNIHWYCAGCGERYCQNLHVAHRSSVTVPPKKENTKTTS